MSNINKRIKVIVGMSGGVDSSVAALLLKEQGYDVHGVFMQNWQADSNDLNCTAEQDLTDARAVCDKLSIPLSTVSFADRYWDSVFQNFLDEYAAGRTPNPDILCNKEIKFKAFLDHALQLGADYIATGHYVTSRQVNGQVELLKGWDAKKDQSYFLYTLTQQALKHSLFPVGTMQKTEVRSMAESAGFPNHAKKDSTGICFIGERKFKNFLQEYLLAKPGNIESTQGDILGRHDGLMYYTLGQRQGLGIGGLKHHSEAPWYVIKKDLQRNVLIIDQIHDHPWLLRNTLTCQNTHWINDAPTSSIQCKAKIRYRQLDQECEVKVMQDNRCEVSFAEFQWAITPGQSVVFYHQELCLGGGIIE